ncbi:hypothetical protein J6590_053691 [Homalodisca vitripennis]|nr:hypothetical protein J6590_053691 [Homalodisca vitripennis]
MGVPSGLEGHGKDIRPHTVMKRLPPRTNCSKKPFRVRPVKHMVRWLVTLRISYPRSVDHNLAVPQLALMLILGTGPTNSGFKSVTASGSIQNRLLHRALRSCLKHGSALSCASDDTMGIPSSLLSSPK